MRVLFVVRGFPPDSTGGTEIHAAGLARILWRRGHDITVLAREARTDLAEHHVRRDHYGQVPVVRVNNNLRETTLFEETYRNPAVDAVARALMDDEPPDVVHVHHLTSLSTGIVEECARRDIPVIVTLHDYWLMCHRGQLLDLDLERCRGPESDRCAVCAGLADSARPAVHRAARWLRVLDDHVPRAIADARRRLASGLARRAVPESAAAEAERRISHMRSVCVGAAHLLAPSKALLEQFVAFGVPRERLQLVELGIDTRPFARLKRQPSERLRIGFVGSLLPSKAPHLAIEAVQGLPPRRAELTVAGSLGPYHGDASYASALRPLLRSPGVRWLNGVAHHKVPSVYESLDVVVVPSIWLENSLLVIREAFAAGLPVVASNLGAMAETVADGRNGLLFEPGSSADLRRVLQRLLDEPGLLDRLREGIPRVRSIDEDAAWTSALYQELWYRRHGRPTPPPEP
ncbi:MAG TPA: glycosyltransferase family 4 protein [Vicinamibacterales bacterium]|nr:glycosyltransferase family 4 protein [Vicinamibacterales bacterium]HOQ59027.1 glycosyltransferase family 4 protein [Vicinamibacterales bacterium]HPK70302.1 glycosyltransferase family 4 protein [Vicinamibacterales bacterium]